MRPIRDYQDRVLGSLDVCASPHGLMTASPRKCGGVAGYSTSGGEHLGAEGLGALGYGVWGWGIAGGALKRPSLAGAAGERHFAGRAVTNHG